MEVLGVLDAYKQTKIQIQQLPWTEILCFINHFMDTFGSFVPIYFLRVSYAIFVIKKRIKFVIIYFTDYSSNEYWCRVVMF